MLDLTKLNDETYYWDNFEEIMVYKIDHNEKLTEDEIKHIVHELNEINRTYGDSGRWTQSVISVIEMCDRYFEIDWESGLTECQEDEFYNQPYEVVKNTYEKTITVTEWNKKNE